MFVLEPRCWAYPVLHHHAPQAHGDADEGLSASVLTRMELVVDEGKATIDRVSTRDYSN